MRLLLHCYVPPQYDNAGNAAYRLNLPGPGEPGEGAKRLGPIVGPNNLRALP